AELPAGAYDALAERPRGSVVVVIDHLSLEAGDAGDATTRIAAELPPGTERGALVASTVRTFAERGARVVVNLRADEIGEWNDAVKGTLLAEAARLELRQLDERSLRDIIERPADRLGLAFEPGLVDRLMSRTESEPGVLPFLQTTLVRLWELRRNGWLTNAAYDRFGGLRGVVVEAADAYYDGLDESTQRVMRGLVLHLLQVAPGGTRATPHRARLNAVAEAGSPAAAVAAEMLRRRLLVASRERGETAIELAHEALARDWPKVPRWLEEERDFLEWLHRVHAEYEQWIGADRDNDLLLLGGGLEEAERMAATHAADISRDLMAYVNASVAQRKAGARRQMRRRTAVGTILVSVAATAATGWVMFDREQTELQRTRDYFSLLEKLKGLENERNIATELRRDAETELKRLQASLEEAMVALRDNPGAADQATASIERAVQETREISQRQEVYVRKRSVEIEERQRAIRDILKRGDVSY
ncbi:MAG: hypothetical protein KDH20_11170, partial [Rhodocyclaceae bacterium]|nr:hypothetical protein [Rhodocyclaceae bacterium]